MGGMCKFSVTPARVTATATPDAFGLQGGTTAAAIAIIGSSCIAELAYIVIPNTSEAVPKYCGPQLAPATAAEASAPVISDVKPFRIGVVSYLPTATVKGFVQPTGATGFQLNYRQIPC